MNLEQLIDQFELITDTEEGLKQFRNLILNLAFRGELTKQNFDDKAGKELLEDIIEEKQRMYDDGEIRKPKELSDIKEREMPFKLPANWVWCRLGNIYHNWGNKTPDKDFQYIDVSSINNEEGEIGDEIEVISPEDAPSRAKRIVKEGTVLYSTVRPYLINVAIYNGGFEYEPIASTAFEVIQPIDGVYNKFIYYYLRSPIFTEYVDSTMVGVAYPAVNKGDMIEGYFPLPPLEEQKSIVQKIEILFSQVDELEQKVQQDRQVDERLQVAVLDDLQSAEIPEVSRQSWQRLTDHFEQTYRKPEHIDQLKQAILNEAVRGRLVPQEQDSSDYFNSLIDEIDTKREELSAEGERRIKKGKDPVQQDEHLWEVPNHWRWLRFQDFILFIDYRGKTPDKIESGIRLITAKNIRSGYIDFDPAEYIAEEDYEDWMTRGIPEKGDLLFTTEAPLGKIAVIDFEEKFALAQRAINFRLLGKVDPYFVQYFIMSNIFQDILLDKATGMTATGIKSTILKKTPFPIPPFEEQKKIIRKIDELFSWCDKLKEKLSRSQQTDQRLLEALVDSALEEDEESKEPEEATIYQMPNRRVNESEVSKLSGISTTDAQAGMMCRIIVLNTNYQGKKEHFGRTKMEKANHIIESHVKIDLGRKPRRMARGAADFKRLVNEVEYKAEKKGWFITSEIDETIHYRKGIRFIEPFRQLDIKLGEKKSEVDRIINLFIPLTTQEAEVRQTVYAAWHDLIAYGKEPTDDEIVKWSSTERYWAKEKENIPKEEFYEAIDWLRENDLVPDGKGKLTVKE